MHVPRLAILRATLFSSLVLGTFGTALPDLPWLGAGSASAEPPVIFKWIDEHGVAHYTTDRSRIPASIRDRIVEGRETPRHRDWLQRDAGDIDTTAPAAAATTTPSARQGADDVEVPEESDGVHAVASEPDWSEAPGGETEWAPGQLGEEGSAELGEEGSAELGEAADAELGEEGEVTRQTTRESPSAPGAEARAEPRLDASSEPVPTLMTEPETEPEARTASAPRVAPPPPPPPLSADGAPVAAPTRAVPETQGASTPALGAGTFESDSELPFDEPPAPATVAAPGPPALAPDERARLEEIDREIASIEGEIARDEDTLMVILSETDAADQNTLVDDPRFRDVAQRLPRLQADLEQLRGRRARIQPRVTQQ